MTTSLVTESKTHLRHVPPLPVRVEPAPLRSPQLAIELSRLKAAEQAKASGFLGDVPFDIQQRIIKTVIDRIIVNPREGWFRIEGAINRDWELSQTCNLLRSPADKLSDLYRAIVP